MSSFRRTTLLLALGLAAATATLAQSSSQSSDQSTSSSSSAEAPDQAQSSTGLSQGQVTVQARIRARRAQRRAAAIREAYDHLYEAYGGMGYLRFVPGAGTPYIPATSTSAAIPHGPDLERAHEYAWDTGLTRYFNERLGVTVDGRGYYGTAYVGGVNNGYNNAITNAAISEYAVLGGPTYRFYMQPKYSVSGRVMAGFIHGNFSGDTNHDETISARLGLWPDGTTYAASASIPVEYNLTPRVSVRVAPEYFLSGFGSTAQNSLGFTIGFGFRFGKM